MLTPLLTVNEVCAILKIKPSTLYNWIYYGKIRPIRLSARTVRFTQAELTRMVNCGTLPLSDKGVPEE